MLRRRGFTAISGAALTAPAWRWLDHGSTPMAAMTRDSAHVSPELMSVIEDNITRLRHLDDAQGGGDALGYVRDQFDIVVRMLREHSYTAPIGKRLHTALAELGQLVGWMAFDSNQHGLAQRYFLAGLHAAHTAGDRALGANVLSMMAYQAAGQGKTNEAHQLATAAEQGAASCTATVRAMVQGRLTTVHAAAGDVSGYERSRDQAMNLLNKADERRERDPGWSYWMNPTHVEAQSGKALVMLARHVPVRRKRLLAEAETLLAPRALAPGTDRYQRSAMIHGGWLAIAHTHAGELDQAITVGRQALSRIGKVNSTRSVGMLRQLRDELKVPSRRHPAAREFMAELDQTLPST